MKWTTDQWRRYFDLVIGLATRKRRESILSGSILEWRYYKVYGEPDDFLVLADSETGYDLWSFQV